MKKIDKFRGAIVGGAVGDALGYPIEFKSDKEIFEKYGENGITEYKLDKGIAKISDDTQMTLFTANGLLLGVTNGMTNETTTPINSFIDLCYKDWFRTQFNRFPLNVEITTHSWLINIPELYSQRAYGITCVEGIRTPVMGTIQNPLNDSKGCGGIMRVAPIGVYTFKDKKSIEEMDMIGANVAALTHGHELGYIPAAALVHIIQKIAQDDDITILEAIKDMLVVIEKLFKDAKHIGEFTTLIKKAINLAESNINDLDAIKMLGQGWVAEETLAIAIYCCLKYPNDFERAVITSVNHSGDSDSTGSVTGNIIGAYLGYEAIPKKFLDKLELVDVITEIADDLYNNCQIDEQKKCTDKIWEQKYVLKNYRKNT